MLSWLGKMFDHRTAVERQRENPVLDAAAQRSAEIYASLPLRDHISEARRDALARQLFLEINAVCNARDPVAACRDELVAEMLKLALFQVLVVPPNPEPDPSGLRAQPGVTGELRAHLVAVCQKNDDLRSVMFEETSSESHDELLAIVERMNWEAHWRVRTLNALRVALGDGEEGSATSGDWFMPFLHATCVRQEHVYRWELELPPAFDENIARETANAYAVFTDIVVSGAADPAAEWRIYCAGSDVPMPDFTA